MLEFTLQRAAAAERLNSNARPLARQHWQTSLASATLLISSPQHWQTSLASATLTSTSGPRPLTPDPWMITLTRAQVREVDRLAVERFEMSSLVLMENAGRGAADLLCSFEPSGVVVVCCGKGNNGGDGFVIARHLDLRGLAVRVLLFANPAELTGDAAANFRILKHCGVAIESFAPPVDPVHLAECLADAAWIVDALLGTGAVGEPRPPYADAIAAINNSGKPVLAIDLPSDLDCDTGAPSRNTIRAAHTATFVAAKPGFLVAGAGEFVGRLHVLNIGAPRQLVELVATLGQ